MGMTPLRMVPVGKIEMGDGSDWLEMAGKIALAFAAALAFAKMDLDEYKAWKAGR